HTNWTEPHGDTVAVPFRGAEPARALAYGSTGESLPSAASTARVCRPAIVNYPRRQPPTTKAGRRPRGRGRPKPAPRPARRRNPDPRRRHRSASFWLGQPQIGDPLPQERAAE